VAAAPAVAAAVRAEPKPRPEPLAKGKAAFTLRLDPARHLKLRLACAVTARSAQQLVTRALDELLASMPELEAMAEQAPVERVSKGV
jgi:predicted HicB family RNase H-like nuclease